MRELRIVCLVSVLLGIGAGAAMAAVTEARRQLPGDVVVELAARQTAWPDGDRLSADRREPGQRVGLRTGAWLGTMRVTGTWTDFRGRPVDGGNYALCYALQPRLKEHAGLDAIRDFALLVAAADEPAKSCEGQLLAASRAVSGAGHPAVLALLGPDAVADPGWTVLALSVGGDTLGFVLVGRAQPEAAF